MNNKGKHAGVSHAYLPNAYTQKWCVRVACALVAYLCTALYVLTLWTMKILFWKRKIIVLHLKRLVLFLTRRGRWRWTCGWRGSAYQSSLQPLSNLQKKAIRMITFSSFTEHSSPLFKELSIVKLSDIITLQLAVFMYKFHNQLLFLMLFWAILKKIAHMSVV